jgi:hypothetical protein
MNSSDFGPEFAEVQCSTEGVIVASPTHWTKVAVANGCNPARVLDLEIYDFGKRRDEMQEG